MCTFPKKETLTIEFKSDKKALPDNDIIDAVVAFANTDGGDIYLGIEDNGIVTGLHPSHRDITRLTAFIANKTVPPVSTRAAILTEGNLQVLKISVPKYNAVVASSTGKIQRRRLKADHTPENVPLYPYEIPHRLSNLSLLDFSAQALPNSTRQDLDATERERLRNIIRTYHGESALLELDDLELDKALRLVARIGEDYIPTVTGMLLIGRQERLQELIPTAESSLQIMDNGQLRINETYTLPLLASIEKINNYFASINQEEEIDVGMFRVPIPKYAPQAFREALVNAYSHRDYSLLGRVRILIEREGITISNPGGFIQGITCDRLLDAEPYGRNPVLADCLKRIGLAERSGRGIDRIYAGSLRYGKMLPDYGTSSTNNVRLYIPASRPDKNFVQLLAKGQEKLHRDFTIYELMVLNQLNDSHYLTAKELAENTGTPAYKLEVTLETLTAEKMIKATQQRKALCYTLNGKSYKTPHNEIHYIKEPITDYADYNKRIMHFAKKEGKVTRADVVTLLHVSPAQAYRLLNRLKENNQLVLEGTGKYSHYRTKSIIH